MAPTIIEEGRVWIDSGTKSTRLGVWGHRLLQWIKLALRHLVLGWAFYSGKIRSKNWSNHSAQSWRAYTSVSYRSTVLKNVEVDKTTGILGRFRKSFYSIPHRVILFCPLIVVLARSVIKSKTQGNQFNISDDIEMILTTVQTLINMLSMKRQK